MLSKQVKRRKSAKDSKDGRGEEHNRTSLYIHLQ